MGKISLSTVCYSKVQVMRDQGKYWIFPVYLDFENKFDFLNTFRITEKLQ